MDVTVTDFGEAVGRDLVRVYVDGAAVVSYNVPRRRGRFPNNNKQLALVVNNSTNALRRQFALKCLTSGVLEDANNSD